MIEENKHIDKLFRNHLSDLEVNPPEGLLQPILDGTQSERRKRIRFLYFRIAAGMALLISFGLGAYLFTVKPREELSVSSTNTLPVTEKPVLTDQSTQEPKPGLEKIQSSSPQILLAGNRDHQGIE